MIILISGFMFEMISLFYYEINNIYDYEKIKNYIHFLATFLTCISYSFIPLVKYYIKNKNNNINNNKNNNNIKEINELQNEIIKNNEKIIHENKEINNIYIDIYKKIINKN